MTPQVEAAIALLASFCGRDVHSHERRGLHIYFDDATSAWWMVDNSDLRELGAIVKAGGQDAYSRWCSDTVAVEIDLESVAGMADEDTDLGTLRDEAGAADDMVTWMALEFLAEDVQEMVAQNAEIAAEVAA